MPLTVGNLITNPAANSFISVGDADAFLLAEGNEDWALSTVEQKERSLISASRWLATLPWCEKRLTDADLARIGQVAARVANEGLSVNLWASRDSRGPVTEETYKAGSVQSTEKFGFAVRGGPFIIGGRDFSYIKLMLRGLLCGGGSFRDIVRR